MRRQTRKLLFVPYRIISMSRFFNKAAKIKKDGILFGKNAEYAAFGFIREEINKIHLPSTFPVVLIYLVYNLISNHEETLKYNIREIPTVFGAAEVSSSQIISSDIFLFLKSFRYIVFCFFVLKSLHTTLCFYIFIVDTKICQEI